MKRLSCFLIIVLLLGCSTIYAEEAELPSSILGEQNAFQEYLEAQSKSDSYEAIITNMVLTLADAFNTAKLGTDTAQAAVHGLIPERVYVDYESLNDKISAVHDYFSNGKIAHYFNIEFADDGTPICAGITLDNVETFVEDGIQSGVFVGSFEYFDLDPSMESFSQVCEKMNITEEVGIVFFELLEDYDIEWLNGPKDSLLDSLTP